MFSVHSGFCSDCGSVLPTVGLSEYIRCYVCKKTFNISDFGRMKSEYTLYFNSLDNVNVKKKTKADDSAEGPIAEKVCKRCGYDQMSYAAMQLRSADEGQTVFYTCLKCKFKETENS